MWAVAVYVYTCIWACVPSSNVIRTVQILRYNHGAPLWTIFADELSECRCDVGLLVRCFCLRSSKIDVSTFEDRGSMCQPSKIDDRCVDLRRSTCQLLKIDDRCVDLRGSMIDVSTFEDRGSMCRPSKIDGRWSTFEDR